MKAFKKSPLILKIAALSAILVLLAPHAVAAGHGGHTKHAARKKNVKKAAPKVVECPEAIKPVVGTWFVNEGGKENHDRKLVLRPNSTFTFIGTGFKSDGKFSFKQNALAFQWTQVDGKAVKPGEMHKEIAMEPDGTFHVDTYLYAKHGSNAVKSAAVKSPATQPTLLTPSAAQMK